MGETPKPRSESLDVVRESRPWDLSLKAFSRWDYASASARARAMARAMK